MEKILTLEKDVFDTITTNGNKEIRVEWLLFMVILIALMMLFKEQLVELLNYLFNDIYQKAITI